MEKFSTKVLPLDKWNKVKEDLKFFWLKKEEQACCFYCKNDEPAFLICYDLKIKSLDYYVWDDRDDRSLIAKIVAYLPGLKNESVQELICPNHLIEIIEDFYKNKAK